MDKIIPIRISESLITELDILIHQGIFRNRNEAIRAGLRALIMHYRKKMPEKEDLARLLANYIFIQFPEQVHAIILFGSVAQNKNHAESDIDLFILTLNYWTYAKRDELFQSVVHLLQKLDIILSLHFEDIQMFQEALNDNLTLEKDIYQKGKVLCGEISFKLKMNSNETQNHE